MDADRVRLNEITERIIGCAYAVSNALGNYLKATGLRLCLLVNFGNPKVGTRRLVNRF